MCPPNFKVKSKRMEEIRYLGNPNLQYIYPLLLLNVPYALRTCSHFSNTRPCNGTMLGLPLEVDPRIKFNHCYILGMTQKLSHIIITKGRFATTVEKASGRSRMFGQDMVIWGKWWMCRRRIKGNKIFLIELGFSGGGVSCPASWGRRSPTPKSAAT